MSQIIELIKVLRDRTGAGMMDCKKALEESSLDVEKAINWLREKGIAKAAKKASRIAADGKTTILIEGKKAIILEVNSETDFVAKSEAFAELVNKLAAIILKANYKTVEEASANAEIAAMFVDATVKLGEKMELRRFAILSAGEGQEIGGYIHMGGKASALVLATSKNAEFVRQLAIHVAANNPLYLTKEELPAEERAKELALQLDIARQDEAMASKPAAMLEKIIGGRVDKHFAESILLSQEYLYEPGQKVEAVLKSNNASILSFVLYQLGEGIEKRVENFAEEVQNQLK